VAFVTVRPDASVDDDDLVAFVRSRLAGFQVPKRFVYGELPKTSTGKVEKNVLRDQAAVGSP
jgi:fatty-acyl-CoA synthase